MFLAASVGRRALLGKVLCHSHVSSLLFFFICLCALSLFRYKGRLGPAGLVHTRLLWGAFCTWALVGEGFRFLVFLWNVYKAHSLKDLSQNTLPWKGSKLWVIRGLIFAPCANVVLTQRGRTRLSQCLQVYCWWQSNWGSWGLQRRRWECRAPSINISGALRYPDHMWKLSLPTEREMCPLVTAQRVLSFGKQGRQIPVPFRWPVMALFCTTLREVAESRAWKCCNKNIKWVCMWSKEH